MSSSVQKVIPDYDILIVTTGSCRTFTSLVLHTMLEGDHGTLSKTWYKRGISLHGSPHERMDSSLSLQDEMKNHIDYTMVFYWGVFVSFRV